MARPITDEMINEANKYCREAIKEDLARMSGVKLTEDVDDVDIKSYNIVPNKLLKGSFSDIVRRLQRPYTPISKEDYEYLVEEGEEYDSDFVEKDGVLYTYGTADGGYALMPFKDEEGATRTPDEEEYEDERALLLARNLDVEYNDIEKVDDNEYEVNGEDAYLVLTYDEAEEMARDRLWDYVNDEGSEIARGISDSYIDMSKLGDWIYNDIDYYWNNEGTDVIIDEAIGRDLVEEGDIFEIDEDESLEQRQIVYSDEIRDDIDLSDIRQKLIDYDWDEVTDYVEYMENMFGDDWVDEAGMESYIDWNRWVDDAIRYDGVANELASYDGRELDLGEYNGEYYYGYRVN